MREPTYSTEDQQVWRAICRELYGRHAHLACSPYLHAWEAVGLPTARIPELAEVTARVRPQAGFRLVPAPERLPPREFYTALADGVFHAPLQLREASQLRHTPQPDLAHAVLGHGILLASPQFARLQRLMGEAARRLQTDAAMQILERVYWSTCEFGVIREGDMLLCCGAAMLSSAADLDAFRTAELRPLHGAALATTDRDSTNPQHVLFVAESLHHLEDVVGTLLETLDDDTPARLALTA